MQADSESLQSRNYVLTPVLTKASALRLWLKFVLGSMCGSFFQSNNSSDPSGCHHAQLHTTCNSSFIDKPHETSNSAMSISVDFSRSKPSFPRALGPHLRSLISFTFACLYPLSHLSTTAATNHTRARAHPKPFTHTFCNTHMEIRFNTMYLLMLLACPVPSLA